jgi:hypothetical protein
VPVLRQRRGQKFELAGEVLVDEEGCIRNLRVIFLDKFSP